EEGRARRPDSIGLGQADSTEGAVPVVPIERRSAVRGDQEVFESVVVVIAAGGAHTVAAKVDAGGSSHVDELEFAGGHKVVAKELGGANALDQEDIEIAVVVVIEERDTCAHDLGHEEFTRRAAAVCKVEAGIDFAEQLAGRGVRLIVAAAAGQYDGERECDSG